MLKSMLQYAPMLGLLGKLSSREMAALQSIKSVVDSVSPDSKNSGIDLPALVATVRDGEPAPTWLAKAASVVARAKGNPVVMKFAVDGALRMVEQKGIDQATVISLLSKLAEHLDLEITAETPTLAVSTLLDGVCDRVTAASESGEGANALAICPYCGEGYGVSL